MNLKNYLKAYPTLRPSLELKRRVMHLSQLSRPSTPYLSHAVPLLSLFLLIWGAGIAGGIYLGSKMPAQQAISPAPGMMQVYMAGLPR